ncbi:MAG: AAA family ATPase [Tetrasphaera sp.]
MPMARLDKPPPVVVVVTGVAGSGKTTLGRALAATLQLPILDLDSLTNPLLDEITPTAGPHWLAGPLAERVRAGRYAALRATAADIVAVGVGVVLVAPFTAELAGGREWTALRESLTPASPVVLYLAGPAEEFRARRVRRGDPRDHARDEVTPPQPHVPHVAIDATAATSDQVEVALAALAADLVDEIDGQEDACGRERGQA